MALAVNSPIITQHQQPLSATSQNFPQHNSTTPTTSGIPVLVGGNHDKNSTTGRVIKKFIYFADANDLVRDVRQGIAKIYAKLYPQEP